MPRQCGLYPPPPYLYPQMRALIATFQCDPEIKKKYLPPEIKPLRSADLIFFSEYKETSIGPYNENLIMLSVKYKKIRGFYVFNIYVTTDEAMAAGREIWGYPKKICDIKVSPLQDGKIQGSLTRKGIKFLDVEIELLDEPPRMDPKDMLESVALLNLKIIPDVADNSKPLYRQFTATYLKYDNFTQKSGAKVNFINSTYSKYDICDEILKDANKDLSGFYIQCDMTLPNGELLE